MREVHPAAGGIHNQQRQFHIRPHLQLRTGLMLTRELHRGKEKPPPAPPKSMSSHSVWSLLLAMCSYHALRPNGLWWLNKDATLPLSVFKHMKSQSTMFLCPFVMHDKTAWLQPHSKTYKKKNKNSRQDTHQKDCTENCISGYI